MTKANRFIDHSWRQCAEATYTQSRPQSTSDVSVGTDTATTCMQDLGTLLLGAAKIWAASNRLISPISHISGIFPIAFNQDQRSLTMNDQGPNSSFSYKTPNSDYRQRSPPNLPFRNPASLSDISAQSHPRKHIHIKRNFYQGSPLNCQSERSLKFRCLRLSISLARAIFAMDGNALACNAKRHSGT